MDHVLHQVQAVLLKNITVQEMGVFEPAFERPILNVLVKKDGVD
jgi:hypothetical protein